MENVRRSGAFEAQARPVQPELEPAAALVDAHLDSLEKIHDAYGQLYSSWRNCQTRQNRVQLAYGEIPVDSKLTIHGPELTHAACGHATRQIDFEHTNPVAKIILGALVDNVKESELPNIALQTALYNVGKIKKNDYGYGATEAINYAKNIAQEKTDTNPTVPIQDVRKILEPFELLSGFDYDAPTEFNVRKWAEAMQELPSLVTLDYLMCSAFADSIQAFMVEEKIGDNLPVIRQIKDKYRASGILPEDLAVYMAATTLEVAATSMVVKNSPQEMAVRGGLAAIAGLKGMKKSVAVASYKDLSLAKSLSEAGKLITNAGETMVEIIRARNAMIEFGGDFIAWIESYKKDHAQYFMESIQETVDALYDSYAGIASDLGKSELLTLEALELEDLFIARTKKQLENIKAFDISPNLINRDLDLLLSPRLKNYIENEILSGELSELSEAIEEYKSEVSRLDSSYLYTSKRIRSYEGGPVVLRSISDEMDKRDLLHDEYIRQTLAIMLLQAEHAEDCADYYEKMKSDRYAIEEVLGKMQFLGVSHNAHLTDALRWIDEAIDAGLDQDIKHSRLRKFMEEYLLGVDSEGVTLAENINETDDNMNENSDKDAPEQSEETESTSGSQTEPKTESVSSSGKELVNEYFTALADILGSVDVEFADVEVFPPGKADKEGRQNTGEAQDKFIDIDATRIRGLVELKSSLESRGKSARLIVTNPTRWSSLPYFALYVQDSPESNTGVCVLENPINGHASYVATIDGELIRQWEEIAAVSRYEARNDFGVPAFVHPTKGAITFGQHFDIKLQNHILTELIKTNKSVKA